MRSYARVTLALSAAALLALSACSKSSTGAQSTASDGKEGRTIRITALDALRFDPAQVSVKAGERIRFVVTNAGSTEHEFFVGDEAMQMSHEQEMTPGGSMQSSGMEMGGMPALTLAPGETKEATATFDQPGQILYGCHEPGHYSGGMAGTITVT